MRVASLVLAAAGLAAADINARLGGVFSLSDGTCAYVLINPNDGSNYTIPYTGPNTICASIGQSWPAYAAVDVLPNIIRLAVATAPNIYAIDVNTGKVTNLAPLPAYKTTDDWLGLVTVYTGPTSSATYFVTQSTVYEASGTELKPLYTGLSLPQLAAVAAHPTAGTNGAPLLFAADEDSATIYRIDCGGTKANVTTIKSGVNGALDLQYSMELDALIELASYKLYSTNYRTGASTKIWSVPDGPGYPRVNTISPDGSAFAFFDFSNVYVFNLTSLKLVSQQPFTKSPRVVGFPVWLDFSGR